MSTFDYNIYYCSKVFSLLTFWLIVSLFFPEIVFASDSVVLNEIYIGSSTGSHQWVELYNSSDQEVDLGGWVIDDSGGSSFYQIGTEVTIDPGGFKSFQSAKFYFNSAGADSAVLKRSNGEEIDRHDYVSSPGDSATLCRYPDGSSSWLTCELTKEVKNISKEGLPTPTFVPTSSPSYSPTATPSPVSATYQINEVKNTEGEALVNVKVYLNDVYLHHYVPETLTFCPGCQCDGLVECGFGTHTVGLKKSGYQDWSERITVESGGGDEIDPVMESEVVDSPAPTSTPTSEPVESPASFLPSTPELAALRESLGVTTSGEILGAAGSSPFEFYSWPATDEAQPISTPSTSANSYSLGKVFLGLGFVFLFSSALFLWYTQLR